MATGAGEETAIYSCQKTDAASYTPLKMKGYEQFEASADWPFKCELGANALLAGLTSIMMAALTYFA